MSEPRGKQRYLIFRIGEERFAINIFEIREVARYHPLQKAPRALPFVKGIIDLRQSEIVPIVDLAERLGISLDTTSSSERRFLIVQAEGRPVGLLVSQVEEVVEVSPEEVLVKPLGMDAPFIAGVLRRKLSKREEGEEEKGKSSRLIFILKMDELFTEKELLHLKEIRERLEKEVSSGSRAKGSS